MNKTEYLKKFSPTWNLTGPGVMKKIIENLLRFFIILSAIYITYIFFKVDKEWLIPLLFSYNFLLIGIFVLYGEILTLVSFVLILIMNILSYIKALSLQISILPFFIQTTIIISTYFLIKKINQTNAYYIFQATDELKILEGEYNNLLLQEKGLVTAIDANKEKLEKYKKLFEIHSNVKKLSTFSEKIRYILRNIIYVFHKNRKISLFLLKQDRFLKVEADRDEDIFYGEKDQESLDLKSFDEWVVTNKKSLIISDIKKEIRFKAEDREKIRSLISVPVICGDKTLGIIRITSDEPASFSQEDLRFLDLIADMLGKILEKENYV